MFKNRIEAGIRLAEALKDYQNKDVIVLTIPRGGVVVAYEVAKRLNAPLDLIIPRKLGAPMNPELAIGAVSQDGTIVLNEDLVSMLEIPRDYLDAEARAQIREIERRMSKYRGEGKPLPEVMGRIVILIDDGLATGATVRAALLTLKKQKPKELIIATPVGPADTIEMLSSMADKVVCLEIPPFFHAIGEFYEDFRQVEDEEVIEILQKSRQK